MYKILPSAEMPMPKKLVHLGYPEHTYPDIVFINTITLQNYVEFNSVLLRELLLTNKEEILKFAGVIIKDASEQEQTKKEPKKKVETIVPTEGEVGWK
jgi:hypothetical protein